LQFGSRGLFLGMFVRRNKNRSGSVSIQLAFKEGRRNKVFKTVGIAHTQREEELLIRLANNEIDRLKSVGNLFAEHDDLVVENFVSGIGNGDLRHVGSQLILAKIYQKVGYPTDGSRDLFKHLVLSRLISPGSKLKLVDYLKKHAKISVSVHTIYRFLDHITDQLKSDIEQITFAYTQKIVGNSIGVLFYDMTTLYFEASEPDELRMLGFNKDGKHQHPQIFIGLLITHFGYPLGYDIFEGNISESHTLLPMLEKFQRRFAIDKPVIVADSALLSKNNLHELRKANYTYILGGRIRNESAEIKQKILGLQVDESGPKHLYNKGKRIVVSYSAKRAKKDRHNREKGLKRLEKKVRNKKVTKGHINNRGYNKYLTLQGDARIDIDYKKFNADQVWDGLKGYVTNTKLSDREVIAQYGHLWQIEKAFRISKTDLQIRPIYHRIRTRIDAHICICFAAYMIYKEFERILKINNTGFSVEKALDEIRHMQELTYTLPKSGEIKTQLLNPNPSQEKLLNLMI